jgi:hypothetical protein
VSFSPTLAPSFLLIRSISSSLGGSGSSSPGASASSGIPGPVPAIVSLNRLLVRPGADLFPVVGHDRISSKLD